MLRRVAMCACAVAGCNDAVTLAVTSDRPIPQALDAMCVGVADRALGGGEFGRWYKLEGKLATLPQTLRVDPGAADAALAWVRGDRGGVGVQTVSAALAFDGEVQLSLDACAHGSANPPSAVGDAIGPTGARLAASEGQGGERVIAIGEGGAASLYAHGRALAMDDVPDPPAGNVTALVAADLDGDCDDDVIVATDGGPPVVWRREHAKFVDSGVVLGSVPASAIAVADVDGDGDLDVIVGGGTKLALYVNDGAGAFTVDPLRLAAGNHLTAVSALAAGDVDGDGAPDLIVGQSNAPLAAWHGGTGGMLEFTASIVPAVTLDVERLALVDADGDYDPDLVVAVRGAPMKLYIDRDGVLEDQTYVRLPHPAPTAHAIAVADWDDACPPDAVLAADAGTPPLRGQDGGVLAPESAPAPASIDVVLTDLDGDGQPDAIFATPDGVQWLAR